MGVLFSLIAAAAFALNAAAARRAVLSGSVVLGLIITVPLGVPLFFVLMLLMGEGERPFQIPLDAWLWFAAAGIVHFVWGRYCNYKASALIGTNLAAPMLQCDVLITLVLAMLLLGEQVTPLRALGIALVLIGPMLIVNRETKANGRAAVSGRSDTPAFEPRHSQGYLMAALAAIAYGVSPVLIGLGLKSAGTSAAITGGFISYIAATLAVLIIIAVVRPRAGGSRISGKAFGWFLLAGTFVFISQAARYAALMYVPVSVMTALQRLSSIFRIYFGWLINRDHEIFDGSVIVATLVSMLGAMALSVGTETFLSLADWPAWVVRGARLSWP